MHSKICAVENQGTPAFVGAGDTTSLRDLPVGRAGDVYFEILYFNVQHGFNDVVSEVGLGGLAIRTIRWLKGQSPAELLFDQFRQRPIWMLHLPVVVEYIYPRIIKETCVS